MKRLALAVTAAVILMFASGAASTSPAGATPVAAAAVPAVAAVPNLAIPSIAFVPAHTFGQPHTHYSGCTSSNCYTWMLANGTWHRGPLSKLTEQWGFVETICTRRAPGPGEVAPAGFGWYRYSGQEQDRNWYTNYGCRVPANANGWGWSELG